MISRPWMAFYIIKSRAVSAHGYCQDLFEVYYQPVYSTEKNDFVTLEALSRLHHPELGWIAPDVFIQIAEKII